MWAVTSKPFFIPSHWQKKNKKLLIVKDVFATEAEANTFRRKAMFRGLLQVVEINKNNVLLVGEL